METVRLLSDLFELLDRNGVLFAGVLIAYRTGFIYTKTRLGASSEIHLTVILLLLFFSPIIAIDTVFTLFWSIVKATTGIK
jgi:hypothetical protein